MVVLVVELDCDVLDCGCSEIEEELLELLGFVEVAAPALGVWFCGGGVVCVWSGVALFSGGFSGVVLFEFAGLATLPEACPVELGDADTPLPSWDDDGVHVSAMCFTFVTVKFLLVDEDDCVWPVGLAAAEALVSAPL